MLAAVASALSLRLLGSPASRMCASLGGLSRQSRPGPTLTTQAGSPALLPSKEVPSQQPNKNSVTDALKVANSGNDGSGAETRASTRTRGTAARQPPAVKLQSTPLITVTKPLPRVLLLHTGGTLGMDPQASFLDDGGVAGGNGVTGAHEHLRLREGTGGKFKPQLQPGSLLQDILTAVPQLQAFANLDVEVVFNKDSCRVGPPEWVRLAKLLHARRETYDAFLVVHGTDTMAFSASALSLMLPGFRKPVVLTGSQLPLAEPRSDARQNLIDSITCATAQNVPFQEVAVCFGGLLMRGNRAQKTHASHYQAFSSPNFPTLAQLGVDVEWNADALMKHGGVYRPRFKLDPRVLRIPIVPGSDPRLSYGDVYGRGVRGVVLEAFGVGNMPDTAEHGWIPWLRSQRKQGLQVYLTSQCKGGTLHPELYRSGSIALEMGVESAQPQMTPECASVKMMLCLSYPDIPLAQPLAGEL